MGERWTKLLESGTDSYLLVQSLPTFDDMRFKGVKNLLFSFSFEFKTA